jgi:GT2 family glycosyltransferase
MNDFIKIKIQIIVVIFEKKLDESITFITWQKFKHLLNAESDLLIYNNDASIKIPQNPDYEIINSEKNNKLQIPYSLALQKALAKGCKWLLLFDDDTKLTADFFLELNEKINGKSDATVPRCFGNNRQISPFFYNAETGNYFSSKKADAGVTTNCVSAFNTCAMFLIESLQKAGGFSPEFEMDFLDNHTFYKLYKTGAKIEVLNAKIEHNLSLLDYRNLSTERYKNILIAEKKFAKILGKKAQFILFLWLIIRFLKQILVSHKRRFAKITFASFHPTNT